MKLKEISLFSLALSSAFLLVNCTNSLSNYGTSFYLGFIRATTFVAQPRIVIGTNSTSNVNFAVKSSYTTLSLGGVTSSSAATVALPVTWLTNSSNYSERHKGLHISASAPIYVVSSLHRPSGATATHLVLPGHQLDVDMYEYIAVSYHTTGYNYWSLVLLIGNEDNTSVTVTSSVTVNFPLNAQDPSSSMFQLQPGYLHTVTLNRLQTLLFGGNGIIPNDMTGTKILSNKPLTVISGNECAFIPDGINGCEPLAVQIPPVATWGTHFLLAPLVGRTSGQYFRVVAAQSNTDVNLTCTNSTQEPSTLSAVGNFKQFTATSNDHCYLESNRPVLVAQLSFGYGTDGTGDPSLILIPSMDQYSSQLLFRTPTGYPSDSDTVTHFINVVVMSGDFSSSQIFYDGKPISFPWSAIRSSNGSVVGYGCGFNISVGIHSLQHTSMGKSLLGIAYGYKSGRAYGYPTGITHTLSSSVKFPQSNYSLSEDHGVINIGLVYTGVTVMSVKVKLSLGNESGSNAVIATPGEDFQLLSGEVTFAVGEMLKNVTLTIYDDEWVEAKEMFSIRLLPEDELLLGSHSTFYIIDNDYLHVGITSALITTSPHYSLEMCVSITTGVLQSGVSVTITLTVAAQGKGNGNPAIVDLYFTQYFIKHCPQLNMLPLANSTELTNGFTLTASLAASDTVQVTLDPSTTDIEVMEVMISTLADPALTSTTSSSMPQLTPTTEHFAPSVPQPASITPHQTTDPAVAKVTEVSLYMLTAVVIAALSVCFITIIISVTVIAGCYCQRAKAQRTVTNTMTPMVQMTGNPYSGMPHADSGNRIYDSIPSKLGPLPDLPEVEEYEDMQSETFASLPAAKIRADTYINTNKI